MEFLWPLAGLIGAGLFVKMFYDQGEKITLFWLIYAAIIGSIFGFISIAAWAVVWVIMNVNLDFLNTVIFEKKKDVKED